MVSFRNEEEINTLQDKQNRGRSLPLNWFYKKYLGNPSVEMKE
jgi:hypothetical protein